MDYVMDASSILLLEQLHIYLKHAKVTYTFLPQRSDTATFNTALSQTFEQNGGPGMALQGHERAKRLRQADGKRK